MTHNSIPKSLHKNNENISTQYPECYSYSIHYLSKLETNVLQVMNKILVSYKSSRNLIHTEPWINLKFITLCGRNQTQKLMHYTISFLLIFINILIAL